MKLSDSDIEEYIKDGRLVLMPHDLPISFDPTEQIQPASVDLTLGDEMYTYSESDEPLDVKNPDDPDEKMTGDEFTIEPKQFALAYTQEVLDVPRDVSAAVKGRSSIGRLGLHIHTAGWVDPEFKGQITLEFVNHLNRPLKLHKGMRICQVVFDVLQTSPDISYAEKEDSKYTNQSGVTPSRVGDDFD